MNLILTRGPEAYIKNTEDLMIITFLFMQAIKSEAELMNFIHRSELMARYESILLGKDANTW